MSVMSLARVDSFAADIADPPSQNDVFIPAITSAFSIEAAWRNRP